MLKGQVALVSGASRGIGKAIADTLGAQGATVVGTATTESGAGAISQRFDTTGIKGQGMRLDVGDEASVEGVVKEISEKHGAITILVNNAGITRDNLLMRMKADDWDAVLNTNLTSVYRLSKACLRAMMKAKTGRIINIASVVGASGNAGQTNYAAAKAGMFGFTKSLAQEWATRKFSIIDDVELLDRGRYERIRHISAEKQPKSWFRWSDVMFDSFAAGYIKTLDLAQFRIRLARGSGPLGLEPNGDSGGEIVS